jgi:8-oxo-dGTP pyrophosphatase MutT (NUDIX family)
MLRAKKAVTSFLESDGEILILLRSERVSTYRGRWAGVSGSIDEGSTADEQALREIEEETSLSEQDIELVRKGEPQLIDDKKLDFRKVVHPYLFHIKDRRKIKIDWEHKEARWIKPEEIGNYHTVPMLTETLARVYKR